ncbi:hypothetical protein [Comamonas fluminis]|uniref:hypothetical protein n=1 Tax=Comamonas fluminis TaxID=2796366 RepID=UPI001C491178|nr:hypothetical protein [Comamonas fluminis]
MKKILCVALTSLLLVACGKTLDGTYTDPTGMAEFTFKGNKLEMMGVEIEYKIEDNKVKVQKDGATVTLLTIKDDGTLVMPMVGELKKK